MALDKELKKRITKDWLDNFPELSDYAQNKLYKILGPCVIGIELIKLPYSDEYRPHFIIYALWQSDLKKCMDAPILIQQIYDKRGLQFDIPYEKHSNCIKEAIDCFRKQINISLSGNVNLKTMFELIDKKNNDTLVKKKSS